MAVFPPLSVRNPHAGVAPPLFTFPRERIMYVAKNALNEDPGFTSLGLERRDEVFGLITLTYVANVPFPQQPRQIW